MSISRIELQGTITRAQDYTAIKQNEDNKGMIDQSNFQTQFRKEVDSKMTQVHHGENAEYENKRFDAKDKGNGQYSGDGGRKRRRGTGQEEDGRVVVKGMTGFDMKI